MDGCKYSSELIILPMKKRMATWLQLFFFYKHTAAERISQTMDDFNISCEIKTVSF